MSEAIASPPADIHQPRRERPWLAAGMLCWREIVRFLRQRNRIVGAIGQPLLFWFLFGTGLNQTFRLAGSEAGGQSFSAYYFPGTLILILLFTAIFATISIIEDRREGFLQAVLVAPIPRWSMVLGKVLGGALLALAQALLFLLLALTLPTVLTPLTIAITILLLFVVALGLTSLGVVIAWRMDSTQGFHAIMSLLLMPMWLLSGAFFPVPPAGASFAESALRGIMLLNPLTYGVAALRQLMYGAAGTGLWLPTPTLCWTVTLLFSALAFAAACWIATRPAKGDLL